ncbi:MAG: MFS transporter [Hyphomicrobium sp.]|nr:MFS transporter [Hyphomicrobium sp.]
MAEATRNGSEASRGISAEERRVIAASSAGTVFEWYDFYLYGALAPIIGAQFFSAYTETQQAIFALLTFAAGFLVRPFGAVVFGRLGDIVGRKYTFVMTVVLMGVATFAVGLLPGYETLGLAAPLALIGLRMLQGLAAGGEYGGAAIYVAEHAPPGKRGFFTSFVNTTSALALLLSLMVILVTQLAIDASYPAITTSSGGTRTAFESWGWRIPFLLSIVLLAISLYIRLAMNESPAFLRIKEEGRISSAPLKEAFQDRRNLGTGLLALFGLVAGQAVVWYTAHFYTLFFMQKSLKVDPFTVNVLLSWAIVISVPFVVLFSRLSDRIGRKPVILGGCALAALTYFPLFDLLARTANPALHRAQASVSITVVADPRDCSFQFNPTGAAKFRTSCDIAKSALTASSARYATEDAHVGTPATVRFRDGTVLSPSSDDFAKALTVKLVAEGYPGPAHPETVRIAVEPERGLANLWQVFDIATVQKLTIIAIMVLMMLWAAMAYGPMAAALVELFPVHIRYTAVSLPYHIGNGWFGGLLPATAFAMVAASGDMYFGLWYPVVVAAATAIIGWLWVPETYRNTD